jgi:hypothetical protein
MRLYDSIQERDAANMCVFFTLCFLELNAGR